MSRVVDESPEVPDLYRLAFMPGQFRCPKCGFQLSKQTINTSCQVIGTTEDNRTSEPCPNDGTMMVHVTYKEQLEVYADRLKEEFDNSESLRAEIGLERIKVHELGTQLDRVRHMLATRTHSERK